jgi:VanZ family protein
MKRLYWILTGGYWLGIFTLTHLPPRTVGRVTVPDTVQHMAAYGVLAILLFATFRVTGWTFRQTLIAVLGLAMVYGAIDELTQPLVGRSAEMADWLADVGGALMGLLICIVVGVVGGNRPQMNTDAHR